MKKILILFITIQLSISQLLAIDSTISITGKFINVATNGTDGDIWNFETTNKEKYKVVISIPNMGELESKKIHLVKENAKLELIGEFYLLGKEKNLTVRKIIQ